MTTDTDTGMVAGWARDTHRLDEVAGALDTAVDRYDEKVATVVRATESTLEHWTGVAADAQLEAVHTCRSEAARVAMAAQSVVAALRARGPDLDHATAVAAAFLHAVTADGYRVRTDGGVEPIGDHRPADVPQDASPSLAQSIAAVNAAGHGDTLRRLVDAARTADAALAADLDAATTAIVAGPAGVGGPSLPTGPPAAVARAWRAATVDQRMAWAAADPGLGNRAGIPVADRDRLNRQRLSGIRGASAAHRALRRRLAHQDCYLLTLRDDGRAVVAVGDPDTARDVAVFVPGTGTTLASVSANLVRADRMRAAAGGAGVSVVVWQDYAAPADLAAAASPSAARNAAHGLGALLTDLRATHVGAAAHHTVIGHSYGSTVVGVTASRPDGVDAGDLVLIASPGAGGAREASDLHLAGVPVAETDDHVYAVTAARDPIRLASPYVLGRDPTSPLFGARDLPAATGDPPWDGHSRYGAANHSGYWDAGSPTLAAMGAVIAGRADR